MVPTNIIQAVIPCFINSVRLITPCYYRKLLKIPPLFLHTTLRQKWGEGIYSNIQFVSCIWPPPTVHQLSWQLVITGAALCKTGSLTERVLAKSVAFCLLSKNDTRAQNQSGLTKNKSGIIPMYKHWTYPVACVPRNVLWGVWYVSTNVHISCDSVKSS